MTGQQLIPTEAYLGGSGHGPPFGQKKIFDIEKKLENLVDPLLCMNTSGQRQFAPPPFRNPKYVTEYRLKFSSLDSGLPICGIVV